MMSARDLGASDHEARVSSSPSSRHTHRRSASISMKTHPPEGAVINGLVCLVCSFVFFFFGGLPHSFVLLRCLQLGGHLPLFTFSLAFFVCNMAGIPEDADRNLIVNFLPQSVTQPALQALFEKYGVTEECKVIVDRATGLSRGFGFVKYYQAADAENAIMALNGMQLENKRIRVAKAAEGKMAQAPIMPMQVDFPQSINLYVAGFGENIGQEELRQVFSPYGSITDVRLINSHPGRKGVAFVGFSDAASATAAIQALNGSTIGTDQLIVKVADRTANRLAPQAVGKAPRAPPRFAQRASPYPVQQRIDALPTQPRYLYEPVAQPGLASAVIPVTPVPAAAPAAATGVFSLFVYPVPLGAGDAYLWKLFGPYGAVTGVDLVQAKGYAFVHMPNYYEALNAINNLNGAMIEGNVKPLQVSFKT
eukprot:TRINITY_DN4158_c0_g1_i4.p2 TRINITY_DN4158_c0_g1~~TRINITY_DN4158_c0_g1_i4.p2  ORF type:complete len:422 (+),score=70.74 TRINITY_DN4158_c0_g1_i4:1731-2996(+)